jgi:phospholipid/cholesterol/gamma-HCH transport system substrate-binding protein
MENRSYALLAGLFIVLLGAGVVVAFIWFTGDGAERTRYVVVSKLPISGLTLQAPVRLRGVDVGAVEAIRFDREDPRAILITVGVDEKAPVTEGVYAQLAYWGISGLTYVSLGDDGSDPNRLPPGGRIEMRPSFIGQAATSAEAFLANANAVAQRVTALLDEESVAQLSRALDKLEQAIDGMGQASQAIQTEVTRSTLPKFNALADDLAVQTRKLDQLLTKLNEQPQSLLFGGAPPRPGPGEPGFNQREGGR